LGAERSQKKDFSISNLLEPMVKKSKAKMNNEKRIKYRFEHFNTSSFAKLRHQSNYVIRQKLRQKAIKICHRIQQGHNFAASSAIPIRHDRPDRWVGYCWYGTGLW
jgi:hypothetical protein